MHYLISLSYNLGGVISYDGFEVVELDSMKLFHLRAWLGSRVHSTLSFFKTLFALL